MHESSLQTLLAQLTEGQKQNPHFLKHLLFHVIQTPSSTLDDLKYVLSLGADPEQVVEGQTALLAAINEKRIDFVEELLRQNVDLSVTDIDGDSPLTLAIFRDNPDIIRKLIAHHTDPVFWNDEFNVIPLIEAARYGRLECLKILVAAGFSLNDTDLSGKSALHVAAIENKVACIEYLVETGASLECRDNEFRTPLFRAVLHNAVEAAEELLKHGADPWVMGKDGVDLISKAVEPSIRSLIEKACLASRNESECNTKDFMTNAGIGL